MTRLRTLWIVAPIAVAAVGMTVLMMVGVNAFVPWLMRNLTTNPKWVQLLSNLSWMIPIWVGSFMSIGLGLYYHHRKPRPHPSARLTLRPPSTLR